MLFEQVIEADKLRLQLFELDNKISAEHQYFVLLAIENTLLGFCRWTLLNDKMLSPSPDMLARLQIYWQEYWQYYQQNLKNTQDYPQQIKQYIMQGLTEALAEQVCFVESAEDFPYLVTLAAETRKSFLSILQLHAECTAFLALNALYNSLKKSRLDDYWEEKVSLALQNDFKLIIASIIKELVLSDVTVSDYFSAKSQQQKLQQYQHIYQQIKLLSEFSLVPYIALKQALARLSMS